LHLRHPLLHSSKGLSQPLLSLTLMLLGQKESCSVVAHCCLSLLRTSWGISWRLKWVIPPEYVDAFTVHGRKKTG
jgi:hypothetical protein